MESKLMYTLDEFRNNYDINVNTQNNNDVMVVIKGNKITKVLQNGINIIIPEPVNINKSCWI